MFDLTKEIKLSPKDKGLYQKFQITLYLIIFLAALYLSYLIIFPHKYYSFSFLNPSSNRNNIIEPRLTDETSLSDGKLSTGNTLYFDTDIFSDYSVATVTVGLNGSSAKPQQAAVSVRRSYQAFMYNQGEPIGWRSGSLLKNNGRYYIISDSKLRKFYVPSIPFSMGYTDKNFQEVSTDELQYNPTGEDIISEENYPDGALFKIADNYYTMTDQKLQKFVSDQAYLSKYDPLEALSKDETFLNRYAPVDDLAGFSDGTLVSNSESVFIISSGKLLPIDNVQTFESKGYQWKDVLSAGEDELAIYQKDKLFNIKSPHPNGTIFKASESGKFYIVENGKKHLLPSTAIAASWLKKEPITASEKALEIYAECSLKKNLWSASTYSCEIPLDKFSGLAGFNYEFSLDSDTVIKLDALNIDYKKNVTKANLKSFLVGLYNSIIGTYAPTSTS